MASGSSSSSGGVGGGGPGGAAARSGAIGGRFVLPRGSGARVDRGARDDGRQRRAFQTMQGITDALAVRTEQAFSATLPRWVFRRISFPMLVDVPKGGTAVIDILSLPAGSFVHLVRLRTLVAFTGGTLTAATIALDVPATGVFGAGGAWNGTLDLFAAPDDDPAVAGWLVQVPNYQSHRTNATPVTATAFVNGDTGSALTTGLLEVAMLVSRPEEGGKAMVFDGLQVRGEVG